MRKRLSVVLAGAAVIALSGPALAQVPSGCAPNALNIPGAPFPCVYPDGRVMFRVSAPDAQKVRVRMGQGYDMTKGADGLWSASVSTKTVAVGRHTLAAVASVAELQHGAEAANRGSHGYFECRSRPR